jgi:murein L,D-transpeptidase YafK
MTSPRFARFLRSFEGMGMKLTRNWIIAILTLAVVAIAAGVTFLYLRGPGPARLDEVRQRRLEPIRIEMTAKGLKLGDPIFVRIFKEESQLELWVKNGTRFVLFKTYPVCKWSGTLGPKQAEGDWQSPEGFYSVSRGQMNPASQFHLAFNLGFPNAFDQAHGRTGSFLMVHGSCMSVGCYAMTNQGIEDIWLIADEALKGGQAAFDVHVFPFRPSPDVLAKHASSQWIDFWRELAKGYDRFEATHTPPPVSVVNGDYVVG